MAMLRSRIAAAETAAGMQSGAGQNCPALLLRRGSADPMRRYRRTNGNLSPAGSFRPGENRASAGESRRLAAVLDGTGGRVQLMARAAGR